jgi:arylsulfatase A-like enzyme
LSLVLAFLANLARSDRPLIQSPIAAIATLLAAAFGYDLWRASQARVLRASWLPAAVLLLPSFLSRDVLADSPLAVRAAASLAAAGLIVWTGRRQFPWGAGAVLSVVVLGSAPLLSMRRPDVTWEAKQGAPGPNVILIVLDTVRADHLRLYGYSRATTPHLEQFARDAVQFRRAVATSDVTLSSHASLFTGLYSLDHGAHLAPDAPLLGHPLDSRFETLAERLASRGYATAAVVANYGYLGPEFGLMQGIQHVNSLAPVLLADRAREHYLREGVRRMLGPVLGEREFFQQSRRAEEINRDAFQILENVAALHGPFFLFLNYMDAHSPYLPPAPYDRRFPGLDPRFTHERFNRMLTEVMPQRRSVTEAERRHIDSQYDGALAYLDAQLGALFDRLRRMGLYRDSMVVVTADHGEALGDRDLLEHAGVSVYQDQVGIPLLVKYPQNGLTGVVERTVSLVDIMPTVLEAAGIPAPDGIAGVSLSADMQRPVFAESYPSNELSALHPRFRRIERTVCAGDLKFVRSSTGKRELFDLRQDAGESKNLVNDRQEDAARLERILLEWARPPASVPGKSTPSSRRETLERLRSLGYVQ